MPLIVCHNCQGLPDLMPTCHWCRGTGKLVDHPNPASSTLERFPVGISSTTNGVLVLASDGSMWGAGWDESAGIWLPWERVPDLPQPPASTVASEAERSTVYAPEPDTKAGP